MPPKQQESPAPYSTPRLLREIWRLAGPFRGRLIFATILRLSSDLAWLYPAYALATVVTFFSHYERGMSLAPLWWTMGLWTAAGFWHYGVRDIAKYLGFTAANRMAIEAQLRTLRHLFRLDMRWQERENSGNKLKRIEKGGDGIVEVVRMWLINYIEIGVNLIGMIFIIATFDALISSVIFVFLFTYFGISWVLTKRAAAASQKVNVEEEDLHGLSFEAVSNIRTVKVLAMDGPLFARIRAQSERVFEAIRLRIFWFRAREGILAVWSQVFRFSMLTFIAWGISQGRYEIGFFILFYEYYGRIWESIGELSEVTQQFIIAKYGVARMTEILESPLGIEDERGKQEFPTDWQTITVRNLTFSYGRKPVLKNLSLTIRRGERVGLVGLSGAGKSTLFKLLLKEQEHYEGEILIDNVPLRTIKKSSYFRRTAVVLQDTEVFNFSLRENIALVDETGTTDEARLQEALSVAHVTDFLEKLPKGIDTVIGEKGVRLSGGEKQRLGIARAVFKQPQILFLDEATSHLDLESEQKIRDSLHCFFQSVTALVIAHRLSTIREMDRILVLEKGEIIEEGTFEELMAKKGRFEELWKRQKF